MSEATQQGASIHDRIEALLSAEDTPQEAPEPEEELEQEDAPEEEETEQEEETEDAPEEDEEPSEYDLSDVAEMLGVEVNDLDVDENGKLVVKTKIDGKEGRAKLAELKKSYQLEGHLNKQNMEVAEMRKQLQQQQSEQAAQFQQRLQAAEDLLTIAQQSLTTEYNSVDWNMLRAADPAEFSAKYTEFQQRQQQIQGQYQKLQQERQYIDHESQQGQQERLREEAQKLVEAIPEWRDEKVAAEEKKTLREYGLKLGYSAEDLANITDHRVVSVLRKAMKFDALQQSKPAVNKRVKKAPRIAKPGQPTSQQDRQKADFKKLRSGVRAGKVSAAEYLLHTGKV